MKPRIGLNKIVTVFVAMAFFLTVQTTQGLEKAPTDPKATPAKLKPTDAYEKVYIYAYPLVLFDFTKRIMTNATEPDLEKMRAPLNQFIHVKTLPSADSKEALRANLDTLYSSAFLDVSKEPMILSLPESKNRYYVMQLMDAWTEVFDSRGTRTGSKNENIAIVGQNFKGTLPKNVTEVKAPTDFVWLLGKTQVDGPDDYQQAHALQSGYQLTPLSTWEKKEAPKSLETMKKNVNLSVSALDQVDQMDDIYFLTTFVGLLKNNPPHPEDEEMIALLKSLGIFPGHGFDATKLTPQQISDVSNGFSKAKESVNANIKKYEALKEGWNVMLENIGYYSKNYLDRATIANIALGANLPEDGISPTTFVDAQNRPLNAGYQYVMHFDKAHLPPTHAFWSLALYDDKSLLVPNPLNRFIIGNRDKLKYNEDGSLDIYLQNTSPGPDKESNWLPTPPYGGFNVTLRIYWPKTEALNGQWALPKIMPVKPSQRQYRSQDNWDNREPRQRQPFSRERDDITEQF